jgi:hypothetical protein
MPNGFDIFAAVFATNVLPGGVAANQNHEAARPNTVEDGEAAHDETKRLQRLKTGRRMSRPRSSPTPPPSVFKL